jgi:dUTPase
MRLPRDPSRYFFLIFTDQLQNMNPPVIRYTLTPNAKYKPKICDHSNGLDLPFHNDVLLEPYQILKVNLGCRLQFPDHFCGLLLNKSSALTTYNIQVHCGLIDVGYTGEIQAVIENKSSQPQTLVAGTAVVQLLVIPSPIPVFQETAQLTDTVRGGFGSTGQLFEPV